MTSSLNATSQEYFVHPSSFVDQPCVVGSGVKIWHFCHIMSHARIGRNCNLGQNVFVASGVNIGDNVKIQNNVSLYTGVELEDDVFCGPSCVFTNVINPRSQINRQIEYQKTLVKRGATLGANSTIVCGATIGRYAFVGAGAVVRGDVPDYALMLGVPARRRGWMSRHGHRLVEQNSDGHWICPESGWRYQEIESNVLRCLDWPEDDPLPTATTSQLV
jgi:UDP-2-acetamido-3-amino-2,3-dideoxy-glucuronate N-acetyltransferase